MSSSLVSLNYQFNALSPDFPDFLRYQLCLNSQSVAGNRLAIAPTAGLKC